MEKLAQIPKFQKRQNIILEGFDPVSAGGFTQVPNCVLKNGDLSAGAKLVYAMLLSYAWHNKAVYPGQDTMAKEMGVGKRSIVRFIAELEKIGYLQVKRRGQGLTNVYVLTHTVKKQIKR